MKILIVDDCSTTRKLMSLSLKSKGFDVLLAENGIDAIEKLATNKVNMIVTDLNMPYMDGLELIKRIRSDYGKDLPILMVTTEADEDERRKAIEAGADGYLVKPVSAEQMKDNIKKILNKFFKGGSHDV
jgi:two-component system chemotaxis response regulator CheY